MSRDLPIWHYPEAVAATLRILRSPSPLAITPQGQLIWNDTAVSAATVIANRFASWQVVWWGAGTAAPVEPNGSLLERRRWRREVGLEADDVGGES